MEINEKREEYRIKRMKHRRVELEQNMNMIEQSKVEQSREKQKLSRT